MAGHGEHRGPRPVRLHRNDRLVLPGEGFGGAEKLEDLALSLAQLVPQLGRKHAGRSIAAQPLTVCPELNVAAAQLGEKA
jgi:hypothetical protein